MLFKSTNQFTFHRYLMKKTILFITSIILLLVFRFILFYLYSPKLENGEKVEYLATIFALNQQYGSQVFISKYSNAFSYMPIKVFLPVNQNFSEAERINIVGTIKVKLINNKNIYQIDKPKIKKISDPLFIFTWAEDIQSRLADIFYNNLNSKDAGLLLGIVFGTKANFDKNFLTDLSNTGVLHVIAASGMNVTMVGSFLIFLSIRYFKRQTGIFISILGVIFYAFIAGFQPSIDRALIMIIFSYGGQILGRQYSPIYGLMLAGFLMLFYDPMLISSVSFQLSFASTLGILMFRPLFPSNNFMDDFNTTFSAQIMSLPIIVFTFGNYGVLSLLVNFLVLWTVPLLMILGGFAAILGLIISQISIPFLYLSQPLLWYFEKVVEFFGSLNWNLTIKNDNLFLIVGYYILVFGIWIMLTKKYSKTIIEGNL